MQQPALGPGFVLLPDGLLTTNPSEVIAGKASIKGSYSGTSSYISYLQTNPSVVPFAPNHSYRVNFQYRILAAAPNGFQAFFNSPAALAQGTPSNPGGTFFRGDAGATGNATFTATLGAYSDYVVLFGINGTGAISIDDIRIEDGANGQLLATEDAERTRLVYPTASVTIRVKVPSNTPAGDTISLFSGMLFPVNISQIPMSRVPGTTDTWQATVSRPAGTIIDYVFYRNGDIGSKREAYAPVGSSNGQIYRKLLMADGASVNEVVAQWIDLPAPADIATGTLTGRVTDQAGQPLAGIWVSAGPHQTLTNTEGHFTVYGVPAGPCTVTVQSENGEYVAASVATTIAPSAVVVANMALKTAATSTATFRVTVPSSTPPGAVPRLYGDTYRLGMVQIPGGPAPDTTRMIEMVRVGGNQWTFSAQLGDGVCVNYLYTLGSYELGYERDSLGSRVVRSLCVNGPTMASDEVVAWKTAQQVPVSLTVTSPTGAQDALYVAANGSPVKMWPTGPGSAAYTLYVNPSTTLNYRYVRNGDPDTGKEMIGTNAAAYRSLVVGPLGAGSSDTIVGFQNQMREPALQTVTTGTTEPIVRTDPFQTGIELVDYWRSSWLPLVQPTLERVRSMNAQWVQIVANWSFLSPAKEDFTTYLTTTTDPPKVDPRFNEFPEEDLRAHIRAAKAAGLHVALTAQPYPNGFAGAHSSAWYDRFFEEVQSTLLSFARLARQEGVEMLVLGNFSLDADRNNDSVTRSYVNDKWKQIIAAIRSSGFTGKLASQGGGGTGTMLRPEYDWYAGLDYLGVFWQIPIATSDSDSVQSMFQQALLRLDSQFKPAFNRFQKPLIFTSIMFYSARTSALQTHDLFEVVSPQFAADPSVPSDYDEQGRAYQALLRALAATPWVQGAYPFAYEYFDLDNKAYSIRSKTAENVVSQIYRQLNGLPPTVAVVEFYNASLDHYFISIDPQEISDLDTGVHKGWLRTGLGFNVHPASAAGENPVCRFYIPPQHGDSHFFSASTDECAQVLQKSTTDPNYSGFVYESPNVFYIGLPDTATGACPGGTVKVYRLWNDRVDSNHRYTTDPATKALMIAKGYKAEGYGPDSAIMCAPQ